MHNAYTDMTPLHTYRSNPQLCSATFTRPQHVGRHLRAHTGDRPYECKECPLRFARSDLLSRHVNKAHKPPDENAPQDKKGNKKGRRKSFPASAVASKPNVSRANQLDQQQSASQAREKPRAQSFNQPQPQLQAQRMYPHHPLLASSSSLGSINPSMQAQTWSNDPAQTYASTAGMSSFVNPAAGTGNPQAILGNPLNPPTFDPPFTAQPMRITESDQGYTSAINIPPTGITYEWGFKKRACDQCNHSKVRCDFADPCLRCAHRNIKCSYNKPQRSRTLGYPLVPSQTSPHTAASQISASPQSHFSSSPHSNSSPLVPTGQIQVQANHHRKGSTASLPANPGQWNNFSANPNPTSNTSNWQQNFGLPNGIAPGCIAGPMQDLSTTGGNIPFPYRRTSGVSSHTGDSNASPQQAMAPTPSLTNNTISPPDIDEPFERRSSYTGTTGPFIPGADWQGTDPKQQVDPLAVSNSPTQFSPTQPQPVDVPFSGGAAAYQWPPNNSSNMWQDSSSTDDDNSVLSSSVNSTFFDMNAPPIEQRRRSSTGQWANALAQMSLHDSTNIDPASIPLPESYAEPPPRRPTFPTLTGVSEEPEMPIPSLSDVKDLWRLFMTEPMTGLTPAGEKHDEMHNAPMITPRPGMGKRTLSKSNSMPDLQSPMLNGPAFFTSFLNGMTPRPAEVQASYIPQQQAAAGGGSTMAADGPDVGKWSKEIQQRQSSFSLQSQPKVKPSSNEMPPPTSNSQHQQQQQQQQQQSHRARPLPSVVQRSSALEQTLAPERVPSFGLSQFGIEFPTIQSQKNQASASGMMKAKFVPGNVGNKAPHGLPSHMARPGNKRLASQTLVGDAGKKATFSLYDEDSMDVPPESQGTIGTTANAILGNFDSASLANYNVNPNPNHNRMVTSASHPSLNMGMNLQHQQSQQQTQHAQQSHQYPPPHHHLQQQQQQQQGQPIQTQSNSMFYPNWSLNPVSSLVPSARAGQ
ncbi:hypothetical protein I316_07230 [Kwoniella heveanensis BCC8398]|uniref:Zn(2)-C6 fungal-type domain-containing protein n=1 Tax=Kwoniella heveanensis BCC8398 TaxID=1296120 RepID=A0A1B9GJ79_9TREE|nr:hypothetical protein I316_07230 [Kwoniella heveanensis BCC8398]